jgi:hypothetical protein
MVQTINQLGSDSADTCLKLALNERDPDDGMTLVAYEKGFFLLLLIEKTIGRESWDKFLKEYFNRFAFESMNTEYFIEYIENTLFNNDKTLLDKINLKQWIYGVGIPENIPQVVSERFLEVEKRVKELAGGKRAIEIDTKDWTTHEWLHFLRKLPKEIPIEIMEQLDEAFHLTQSGNAEILCSWFQIAIQNSYKKAFPAMETFLMRVGRRKFLVPIYNALLNSEEEKQYAKDIYAKARPNYHYVSTNTLDERLL